MPGNCGAARGKAPAVKSQVSGVGGADDQRREPAEGRQPRSPPRRRLGFEKPVAVAGGERLHDRLLRHPGLDQHPALMRGAAGAATDLVQQLIGSLGGAQITAGKPQIGIDDADQGQHRKMMPFGDDLRADQHIVPPLGHGLRELGGGAWAGEQVAGHHRRPRCRKALCHFLEQALDTRVRRARAHPP